MEYFKFERIPGTPLYTLIVDGERVGDVWTMDEIMTWLRDEYRRESRDVSDR